MVLLPSNNRCGVKANASVVSRTKTNKRRPVEMTGRKISVTNLTYKFLVFRSRVYASDNLHYVGSLWGVPAWVQLCKEVPVCVKVRAFCWEVPVWVNIRVPLPGPPTKSITSSSGRLTMTKMQDRSWIITKRCKRFNCTNKNKRSTNDTVVIF